jgi:hypothetical protein
MAPTCVFLRKLATALPIAGTGILWQQPFSARELLHVLTSNKGLSPLGLVCEQQTI